MTIGTPVRVAAGDNDLREALRRATAQAVPSPPATRRELSPALKWTAIGLLSASALNLALAAAADDDNARRCEDFGCRKTHLNIAAAFGVAGATVLVIAYKTAPRRSPSIVVSPDGVAVLHSVRF